MEQAFRCAAGHAFDIAKEGYVNLLAPQHRRSKDPGYSKEMIAGRRDFFDAGHYRPLADDVAALIAGYLPTSSERLVVDAGCGEGYYLRRLRATLAAIGAEDRLVLCGLDISKHGIRIAAKRDPSGLYAVAGTFHLPLCPPVWIVLLAHFSPVSAPTSGGWCDPAVSCSSADPGRATSSASNSCCTTRRHCMSRPMPSRARPASNLVATHRIRHQLALRGPGQVANLLLMTPYYWSEDPATRDRLASLEVMDTEIDVLVHAYRRTPTAESELGPDRTGL